VIDGAKALAAAVTAVFGDAAVVQRCQVHKRRNVVEHLPHKDRERVDARLRGAFADPTRTAGCARPGCSPPSSTRRIPTRPPRCAKASPTCSPCAAWGSTGPSPGR
jgi:hypothetical protein